MTFNNIRNLAKDRFYLDVIKENYKYANFAISRAFRDTCSTQEKQRYNIVLAMIQNKTYEFDIGKVLRYIYSLPVFSAGIIGTLYNLVKEPCYTTNTYRLVIQDIIKAAYGVEKIDFTKYTFLLEATNVENVLLENTDLNTELQLVVPSNDVPRPTDEIANILKTCGWTGLYHIIQLLYNFPVKRA